MVPARDGEEAWVEDGESFWRMLTYVEGSRTVDVPEDAEQAREVGQALGSFHALIHDLPVDTLADTLEGFHVTPLYLAQYRRALAEHRGPVGEELAWAQAFVAEREELADVLEGARERGELRPRPIHGDPKVNNVLLDAGSGAAIGLVDLDTVKPGLVQWDIGDCLRSACNPLGEETEDWRAVRFDPSLAEALLTGYLGAARGFLEETDYAYVVPAIRLIAFELGLRFLADHLAGDVYFRTTRPGHNLARALVQFRLTESIEAQAADLEAIVARLREAGGVMGGGGAGSNAAELGQAFQLLPFPEPPVPRGLAVDGWIRRQGEQLTVTYRLHDPEQTLAIPPLTPSPQRRDGLWQASCVELFLALPGQGSYRELNLSPNGDWAVYRLEGYRQGLTPDPSWCGLPLRRKDGGSDGEGNGILELQLDTPLPPELAAAPELEVAITAVLQGRDGTCSYWALLHPGTEADFHRRDGFALRL